MKLLREVPNPLKNQGVCLSQQGKNLFFDTTHRLCRPSSSLFGSHLSGEPLDMLIIATECGSTRSSIFLYSVSFHRLVHNSWVTEASCN